jgi:hypothetical protein
MVSTEMIQTGAQMAPEKPSTSPSSPSQSSSEQLVTLNNVLQFIYMVKQLILKLIDAKSKPPKSPESAKPGPEAARASKLECKTVTEVYASNGMLIKHG